MDIKKIKQKKSIAELLEFCIINVDKPSGMTSFQVAERVKKMVEARKSGHFGTLDPKVTGVLPVALNRACKLTDYFMHKNKVYIGKMYLHKDINEDKLKKEMKNFIGKIKQLPPVKSRVKRQIRERMVNRFEILKFNKKIVEFIAEVEAGTYIRKICSDLGEKIGGAHMTELRRVKAGIFEEKNSFSISDIEKAFDKYKGGNEKLLREILIPAEIISELLPMVQVKEEAVSKLLTGKPIFKQDIIGILPCSERFAVFSGEKFIEVARKTEEAKKGEIIARPEFVFN